MARNAFWFLAGAAFGSGLLTIVANLPGGTYMKF